MAGACAEPIRTFRAASSRRTDFPPVSEHATHVACTIAGAGLSPHDGIHPAGQSKGMAYGASLHAYENVFDEIEMAAAAANGLILSNHSYGVITGWD